MSSQSANPFSPTTTGKMLPTESTVATTHPAGFWFFFWGEFAERCSYYGMRAILALYMVERLNVSKANAATYIAYFIAACYFFPLIGGWLADNYLGKYWTIMGFSLPYVIAQFMVGVENPVVVVISLVLLAMGSGVIKPNISTLMGMTYDQYRPGQDQLRTSAFSWFYLAINIGATLSQFGMPELRDRYGYRVAFMFPAVCMMLALIVFGLGKRYYAVEHIERKSLSEPERAKLWKLRWETLYRVGPVFLSVMFFWAIFDQAAVTWIFFAETYMNCVVFGRHVAPDAIQAANPLFIVLLVPVSVAFFKWYPVKATSKLMLGFALTGLTMLIMSVAGLLAGEASKVIRVNLRDATLIIDQPADDIVKLITTTSGEDAKKEGSSHKFKDGSIKLKDGSDLQIRDGNADLSQLMQNKNVLQMVEKNESKRETAADFNASLTEHDWVDPSERVTVWWQILAYLILTVAEILISVTGLELAFVASPSSMKSFITACWLAVVFLANFLINAHISPLYSYMPPAIYFAMLAFAMVIVILVFIKVAATFNRKMATFLADESAKSAAI